MKDKKLTTDELIGELKEMHVGNIMYMLSGKSKEEQEIIINAGPQRKREVAYKQIKELIDGKWGAEIYYLDTIKSLQQQLDEAKNERK